MRVNELRDDYYVFDEERYQLIGETSRHTYKLGQSIRIQVLACDRLLKTIDFIPRRSLTGNKTGGTMGKESFKLVANNKKAYHDYFIDDKIEAGIELFGTEVKSIRMGKCSVKESFIKIEKGEMFIYGMHISPYEKGNIFNKDSLRVRKLLLHKVEIRKLEAKVAEKGYTLVPLQVYFKGSLVKVEVGLARGKKLYDKRQDIAKKDQKREVERDFKLKFK